MPDPRRLVDKFIMPWVEKNHPHADIVLIAGSWGRALRQGDFQPLSSSDVDLVVIYSDLEKGGFKAATKTYAYEDTAPYPGAGAPPVMMVDANIHDYASLYYHEAVVRDHAHFAFLGVMLEEGSVLVDKSGVGPVLQERAARFLEAGPAPETQGAWKAETGALETTLADLRGANSVEEKRFLGVLALEQTLEYVLGLNRYWRNGSNQAYRSLARKFPAEGQKITDAFSALLYRGDSAQAEAVMAEYAARGRALLPGLPAAAPAQLYPADKFVPPEEIEMSRKMFFKFMSEHLSDALETSQRRGVLAHLEDISATVNFVRMMTELNAGSAPLSGRAAMNLLNGKVPDLLPVTLQALDEKAFGPLRDQVELALAGVGGTRYTWLQNYYLEDVARVYAVQPPAIVAAKKRQLPGFRP